MFVFPFTKMITYDDVFHFEVETRHVLQTFETDYPEIYNFLIENDIDYELYVDEIRDDRDLVLFYRINLAIYNEAEAALYKLVFSEIHN